MNKCEICGIEENLHSYIFPLPDLVIERIKRNSRKDCGVCNKSFTICDDCALHLGRKVVQGIHNLKDPNWQEKDKQVEHL